MSTQIYRKVALERLSSPEQLDMAMEVTPPKGWIALSAVGVLLVTVVVWGFAGSIPEKVDASGILLRRGGIFDIPATAGGQILEVTVAEGAQVKKGQVVARIAQPEMVKQIANLRSQLEEQKSQHGELSSFSVRDQKLRGESVVLQRRKLEEGVRFLEERQRALKEQLDNSERLAERGLITKQSVLQTREQYFRNQDQLQASKNELQQLEVGQFGVTAERGRAVDQSRLRLAETQRQIELYEKQLERTSTVQSPHAGRVLEMKLDPGAVVGPGQPLMSLQLAEEGEGGVQALVYVSPVSGKNVRPGMEVQISPSTARREEYGFLIGKVGYVSEFPASREGMIRVLPNQALVASLSGQGAPFAVYAELERDPATESGYKWSSPKARTQKVASGTLCAVTIILRERRPIELVIPLLREYTGI